MGYSNEYYSKAINIIKENRKKSLAQYNQLLDLTYSAVPRLSEIDARLSALGAKAMTSAMSGNQKAVEACKAESEKLQNEKQEIITGAGITSPKFKCKKCDDTGFVNNKKCDCVNKLAKKLVLQSLNEHMPLSTQNFNNFDLNYYPDKATESGISPKEHAEQIYNNLKNYANNFTINSDNIFLTGSVGLGKTHLCMSIINVVTEKGYGVIYGSAQNLFSLIEREHFSSGSGEKLDAMLNADLLVIDDLGTEFLSAFTASVFYNIINTRINNRLPTIINTNLSFKELEERYSARISSRIVGNYKFHALYGKDIRQIKAFDNMNNK